MKIGRVAVTYGELRSTGYPTFSNKRYELTLSARLEEGETARQVKDRLLDIAKAEVTRFFEPKEIKPDEMDIPF